jgi:hypothetical protein
MCDACLRGKTNQVHVPESVEADVNPAGVFEDMHMDIKDLMCKSLQKKPIHDVCSGRG